MTVDDRLDLAVSPLRYDGCDIAGIKFGQDGVGVVSLAGEQNTRRRSGLIHYLRIALHIRDLTAIRENGATNWILAAWNYDNLGRRTAMTCANGANTSWSYNAEGQLGQLKHDLRATADDQTLPYTYNPAGKILSRSMSDPAHAYAPATGTVSYVNNGRNQVTSATVGSTATSFLYDPAGRIS